MDYATAKRALDKAQAQLKSWDKALRDPRKFYPVIKAEWDRAFDRRERAWFAARQANPDQFAIDYPQWAHLAKCA